MAKYEKGHFKVGAVQPFQSLSYGFNISGNGTQLPSIAYLTEDEADEANTKITEALKGAMEVTAYGL